jgi:hypothetical protein
MFAQTTSARASHAFRNSAISAGSNGISVARDWSCRFGSVDAPRAQTDS